MLLQLSVVVSLQEELPRATAVLLMLYQIARQLSAVLSLQKAEFTASVLCRCLSFLPPLARCGTDCTQPLGLARLLGETSSRTDKLWLSLFTASS